MRHALLSSCVGFETRPERLVQSGAWRRQVPPSRHRDPAIRSAPRRYRGEIRRCVRGSGRPMIRRCRRVRCQRCPAVRPRSPAWVRSRAVAARPAGGRAGERAVCRTQKPAASHASIGEDPSVHQSFDLIVKVARIGADFTGQLSDVLSATCSGRRSRAASSRACVSLRSIGTQGSTEGLRVMRT